MNKLNLITLTCCLILSLNGFSQITVSCSGNVGISQSSPSYNLDLYGTGRLAGANGSLLFGMYNSVPAFYPSSSNNGTLGTTASWFYSVSSLIVNAGTVYEESDENIKENIGEVDDALNKVLQIRGVTYDLKKSHFADVKNQKVKETIERDRKNQIGFLAQELEEVFPELVHFDSISRQYSVCYTRLAPILVEAIKEQQSLIEELKLHINNLENTAEVKSAVISSGGNKMASLDQNIPNPFNQTTSIKCYVPEGSQSASIYIFDMQGAKKEQLLITGYGIQTVKVDGYSLDPGMYLYSLIVDDQEIDTKRMILTD